jgi:uncharacterized membrane protein YkvA (DUF1232 family)
VKDPYTIKGRRYIEQRNFDSVGKQNLIVEKKCNFLPENMVILPVTTTFNFTMAESSLITQILRSIFFKKATGRAGRYASNSSKLYNLAKQVLTKVQQGGVREGMAEAQVQIQLLVRLIKAYASGEYRKLPWKSLVSIVGVLIYFVSPLDFIPDFLPIVGMTDDLALVLWLFKTLSDDLSDFSQWEKKSKTINIG